MIDPKLWKEFIKWGASWNLEAERDYDKKGKPLIYHLTMWGLDYQGFIDEELVGYDLNDLLKQAIKYGKDKMRKTG